MGSPSFLDEPVTKFSKMSWIRRAYLPVEKAGINERKA